MTLFSSMDLSLVGKTALVCGSTQGIGKAAAIELAELGATVVLLARNEELLKSVCQELPKKDGQQHSILVADFSFPDQVKRTVESFVAGHTVNILVNNTGGPPGGPIVDASLEEFEKAFTSHLMCNHILAQAVVDSMKNDRYGRIINIISTSVKIPLAGLGVSNTIRGAVASWSKTMANELGAYGITVNNVLPGATNTGRLTSIIQNKAAKTNQNEQDILENMANAVPMKRIAEPKEIANMVAFLASPAASYVNGVSIPVDGGRTGSI